LRNGIEGFYIAVRGSVEDYNKPKLFFSDKGLQFVKEVLELEPQQLALKFEAWCMSGLGKISLLCFGDKNKLQVIQIRPLQVSDQPHGPRSLVNAEKLSRMSLVCPFSITRYESLIFP
jgi:hypothetical protein